MQRTQPRGADYVVCYALYAAILVLGYVVYLVWKKTALFVVLAIFGGGQATSATYGTVGLLVLIALFVVAMIAEPYLRTGVRCGQTSHRFTVLATSLGLVIALGLALQVLLSALGYVSM